MKQKKKSKYKYPNYLYYDDVPAPSTAEITGSLSETNHAGLFRNEAGELFYLRIIDNFPTLIRLNYSTAQGYTWQK